ncbi:MAG: type II secretion system GspH family protein [Candidatus Doudnabacteria bacterium]|nr:type II secretion system GspH family protein [Candidatus Doudnabacteria bacterium]
MKQKGFTLIELLVVIAIIGILAVVIIINLSTARVKGRDARRISDLNQARKALELYYNDCGQYPPTLDPTEATGCQAPVTFGDFLANPPADPQTGTPYTYTYDGSDNTFALDFTLEGGIDLYGAGPHTMTQDAIQ